VEQQNPYGFPSHAWNQSLLHGFLGHQSHGPPGATFWRVAADHGNDALLLAVLQQPGRSRPPLVVKGLFQAGILVTAPDLPHRFRRQAHVGGHLGDGLAVV